MVEKTTKRKPKAKPKAKARAKTSPKTKPRVEHHIGNVVLNGDKVDAEGFVSKPQKMKKGIYDATLTNLQIELVKLQEWIKNQGLKVVVIFEGRDAAGKGGAIIRIIEKLNPRVCRVVALGTATERQKSQWYFQRYVEQLPAAGEMVLFDRSWYNRAGVEKVMGFCSDEEYLEFLRQTPELERMLINSGIRLFKYWFSVSREEQFRRLKARQTDPLKQWKLSPVDKESMSRWGDYSKAKDAMIFYTDTRDAPWTMIRSDDKKRGRLNCIRHFLHHLNYPGKDKKVVSAPNPLVVGPAKEIYERGENV